MSVLVTRTDIAGSDILQQYLAARGMVQALNGEKVKNKHIDKNTNQTHAQPKAP